MRKNIQSAHPSVQVNFPAGEPITGRFGMMNDDCRMMNDDCRMMNDDCRMMNDDC